MFRTLGKTFSRQHIEIYSYFSQKTGFDTMQITSNRDNLYEISDPAFLKKKKKKNQFIICWISPKSGKS